MNATVGMSFSQCLPYGGFHRSRTLTEAKSAGPTVPGVVCGGLWNCVMGGVTYPLGGGRENALPAEKREPAGSGIVKNELPRSLDELKAGLFLAI